MFGFIIVGAGILKGLQVSATVAKGLFAAKTYVWSEEAREGRETQAHYNHIEALGIRDQEFKQLQVPAEEIRRRKENNEKGILRPRVISRQYTKEMLEEAAGEDWDILFDHLVDQPLVLLDREVFELENMFQAWKENRIFPPPRLNLVELSKQRLADTQFMAMAQVE